MKDAWGNKNYMVTASVTIKAFVRVLGDLLSYPALRDEWRKQRSYEVFLPYLEGWKEMIPDFRKDGFYERFAARGQIERVRKIHTELKRRL
jgi:hypothetical protein